MCMILKYTVTVYLVLFIYLPRVRELILRKISQVVVCLSGGKIFCNQVLVSDSFIVYYFDYEFQKNTIKEASFKLL